MTPPTGEPTFELLIVDLLDRMLRDLDDPERMSATLCESLRELTGARYAAVTQFDEVGPDERPLVVWFDPPRKRSAEREGALLPLVRLCRADNPPHRLLTRGEADAAPHAASFDALDIANALLFPLAVGAYPVGCLLLAGLPEENRTALVAGLIRRATSLLALALRQSLLFERREAVIRARTRDLAASEALLSSLVEALPVAALRAGADGIPLLANAPWKRIAAEAGLAAGDPWHAALHPDDRAETARRFAAAAAGGAPFEAECRLVSSGDEPRTALVKGAAIRGPNPEAYAGAVVTLTDVTASKRAEAIMARADKLESLGVLAGGIAHDFNNLIAGVLGNLSFALADLPAGSPLGEPLRDAEAAALRAKGLTGQLLAFARGGIPVRETADLAPLIAETCRLALAGSRSTLALDLAPDLPPAAVDAGQFCQVIQNLAINAAQAMPAGGTVRVAARAERLPAGRAPLPPGDYVRIEVADAGEGIPPERLRRIFDPFFTTKPGGSGLGLAICDSVARRHGGIVECRSEPGKGSVFSLILPAAPGAPLRASETGAGDGGPPRGSGRVLVVDDEPAVRSLLTRALDRLGFRCEAFADGREGISAYRDALAAGLPFAFAILDLTIPGGMGGLETFAALRALDPGVTALVSSGYSEEAAMADARSFGFAAALRKPFRIAELEALLVSLGLAAPQAPDRSPRKNP